MNKNKLNIDDSVLLNGLINKENYNPIFLKQLFTDLSKVIGDENAVQRVLVENSVSGKEGLKQSLAILAKVFIDE